MTHQSQIFVTNHNQSVIGSSLDPKSVHKLKNEHESRLWHQRFTGGAPGYA